MEVVSPIMLCYLTSDEAEIQALHLYWEMDSDGKFIHSAEKDPMVSAKAVKKFGQACIKNRKYACGHPFFVFSRNGYISQRSRVVSVLDCDDCRERKNATAAAAAAAAKESAHKKLLQEIELHRKEFFEYDINYETLPFRIVFILDAMNRAMGGKLLAQDGTIPPLANLMPFWNHGPYRELYGGEAACPVSVDGKTDGFLLNSQGKMEWYPGETHYRMREHITGSLQDAISIIESRVASFCNPADIEPMVDLWSDVATQECLAYLSSQLDFNNLPWPSPDAVCTLEDVFRASVREYGPSKVWCAIWKCVKDVAALSVRAYYTREKAVATLPGKIQRYIGEARAGARQMKNYNRPEACPHSEMTLAFIDHFGFSDATSVIEAREILERLAPPIATAIGEPHDALERAEDDWIVGEVLRLRAALMGGLQAHFRQSGLPISAIAEKLEISDERATAMMYGEVSNFDLELLVIMVGKAGLKVDLVVSHDQIKEGPKERNGV